MMKLYGSTTSPYVRRLRILMANVEHDFVNMQIFEKADREQLAVRNPTLKVPFIEDGDQVLFDSRVIYGYLSQKLDLSPLDWDQENLLTLIDGVNDSLVQMFLLSRSDINTSDDLLYFRLQRERIDMSLGVLEDAVKSQQFSNWDYPEICLYALIDWALFRDLHDLATYKALLQFHEDHRDRIEVTATDPRS